MTIPGAVLLDAVTRLHAYLLREHWNGQALQGPDAGIRFNARIGRFIKSYLHFLAWKDAYAYAQTQKYWILDNWLMVDLLGARQYADLALACSKYLLTAQHPEGYWPYPNPEWKGRIATVEGNYATLGLLETYCRTHQEPFLLGAKKWVQFVVDRVGFQGEDGLLAVNYFANVHRGMVPNNSASTLRVFAKLARATGDDRYIRSTQCQGMVAWLSKVQLETGELPYAVGNSKRTDRIHFLCYQYNAFQFLGLVDYYRITGDQAIWPVLEKLALFVSRGILESGAARYDCHRDRPEVPYYTAALAAALSQATLLGVGDFRSLADRAYKRVLSQQTEDGGLEFFSRGNYGFLSDRRSYPRNLSMILYHLLLELQTHAHSAHRAKRAGRSME